LLPQVLMEEDDCPELIPIEEKISLPSAQIPVTIITGYLVQRFIKQNIHI
uniref:Uncharacterized protein n=1 Tax=Astyanax mexicanus TaxID=7994 RepID=A0A8B9HEM6_ASTMX